MNNNDNPLNFSTTPMEMKTSYAEVIHPTSPWYHQAYQFLFDWLREIGKQKRAKKPMRGRAYTNTLKAWRKLYPDQELSDVATRAQKVMDAIRNDYPEIGKYL